jgi:hypothetical protein
MSQQWTRFPPLLLRLLLLLLLLPCQHDLNNEPHARVPHATST